LLLTNWVLQVLEVTHAVAAALHHVHSQGYAHNDVKVRT